MAPNLMLEIKVILRFVEKDKQDRYIQLLSSIKTRHKFIESLPHFKHFRWEYFEQVKGEETDFIVNRLNQNKIDSSKCYIISENPDLDTEILDVRSAMKETVGYGRTTILVCGEAEMIYFEDEGKNNRYISNPTKNHIG